MLAVSYSRRCNIQEGVMEVVIIVGLAIGIMSLLALAIMVIDTHETVQRIEKRMEEDEDE